MKNIFVALALCIVSSSYGMDGKKTLEMPEKKMVRTRKVMSVDKPVPSTAKIRSVSFDKLQEQNAKLYAKFELKDHNIPINQGQKK